MSVLPFPGQTPDVAAPRCLNLRHNRAGCMRCADGCPTGAIRLENGAPTLDEATCVRCGLCVSICPTDVYTQPNSPEDRLAQVVAQVNVPVLALTCALHTEPGRSLAPGELVVQHQRCLAALGPAQLLALSDHGRRTLWLDDAPCAACVIGAARSHLAQVVNETNAWLGMGEQAAAVHLATDACEPRNHLLARRPVLDGSQPKVSRRGLLGALRAATRQATRITERPNDAPASEASSVYQRLPQRTPASRVDLLAQLAHLNLLGAEQIATTPLPVAAVQVDESACSACGLCARFCPTGALHFDVEDDRFALVFQAAVCVDCAICVLACPEQAIHLGDTLCPSALAAGYTETLVAGALTPCGECGAPTAYAVSDDGGARCYACRHGAGIVRSLRDGAGLMDDLLSRI